MTDLILFFGIYVLGVIVSLVMIAWFNSDGGVETTDAGWAAASWLFVLAIVITFLTFPFYLLYEKLLKYFENRNRKHYEVENIQEGLQEED